MLIALVAAVTPLVPQEPVALHPSDAVFVIQMADIPALRTAYAQTALALMLGDEEVHEAIGNVMKGPPLDPIAMALDQYQLAVDGGEVPPILDYLDGLQAISMSVTVEGGDFLAFTEAVDAADDEAAFLAEALGVRIVVDFVDEVAAEEVFAFLADFLEKEAGSRIQVRTRAITAPNGGGSFGSDKLTVRSFASAPDEDIDAFLPTIRYVTGGKRLVLLMGNVELESTVAALVNGADDGSAVALLAPGRAAFGDAVGVPMVEFYMQPFVERLLAQEAPEALPLLDVFEGLFGPLASMAIRGGHWRIGIDDGQFITQGITEPGADGPMTGMIGAKPLSASALMLAHPDALITSVTSLDTEVLTKTIEMVFEQLGEGKLDEIEAKYGFRPDRDIAGALGDAVSYSLPSLRSLMSPPNLMGAAALEDREAFIRGMDGLFAMAEDLASDVQVTRSEYRGSMVYTISFTGMFGGGGMSSGLPFDPSSFVKPTITVMADRVLVTTLATHAKREIRRVAKLAKTHQEWVEGGKVGDAPDPGIHKGISAMGVPEGATTVGYADWPTFFGKLYTQLKSLAPMLASMAGEDLPVVVSALPDASLLIRHFRPSERWTRRADGVVQHYAKSSIGPEMMLFPTSGLLATLVLPRAFARPSSTQWVDAELIAVEPVELIPAPVDADADELAWSRTKETLTAIELGLLLYQLDHKGEVPADLATLLTKTSKAPDAYLDGEQVPNDGWDRPFVYVVTADGHDLRSKGSDGVAGTDDDVTPSY